jgi:alcohol dehydrogenase (cytochrome c)
MDPKEFLHPSSDSWLTYRGEYNGQSHSKLAQITPSNISRLKQVWRFRIPQNQALKASPIVVDGYITAPDHLWVIDARTPRELWHYQHPKNNAVHIGHNGAAIYKDPVYLTTPDCHLIAFNSNDGNVKWDIVMTDAGRGVWPTKAPLVVCNPVIVGVAGDFDNVPGILKSFDADTGKLQ